MPCAYCNDTHSAFDPCPESVAALSASPALIEQLRKPIHWEQSSLNDWQYVRMIEARAIDALLNSAADALAHLSTPPAEVAALIERLRYHGTHCLQQGGEQSRTMLEAADALARLQQERDEARFAPMGDNHHNAAACPYCRPALTRLSAPVPDKEK